MSDPEQTSSLASRFEINGGNPALIAALGLDAVALVVDGRIYRHRVPNPTAIAVDVRLDLWAGSQGELARLVDQRSGTKDLYLTTVLLEQSPGEYKPLVAHEAEKKAAAIMPDSVVPFDWQRGALQSAIVIGVLLAAMLWMPQFDPFDSRY